MHSLSDTTRMKTPVTIQSSTRLGFTPLLVRLHNARRAALPPMGMRTRAAVLCAMTLAVALISIILSLSWVQNSELSYLENSSGVTLLRDLKWTIKSSAGEKTATLDELAAYDIPAGSEKTLHLYTTLPEQPIAGLMSSLTSEAIVFSLPEFQFDSATVTANWSVTKTMARGEIPMIAFTADQVRNHQGAYLVHIELHPSAEQSKLLKNSSSALPAFISGMIRYRNFQDFSASKRVGNGKQLADIGRIVLALFTVLLFVFIDSSPECFGLGIFMSLKALGVVAAQRWYPDMIFPIGLTSALPGFLLSFADFMQLYFFTQLSRLFKPRAFLWLGIGVIFGCLYTYGINRPTLPGGINWSREVWRYRNLLIGIGCLACSLPVTFICFKERQYHRMAALIVASSGVLSQVLSPIFVDYPEIMDATWFKTWYNLFETHTPYVFALSTFINVSTLERRVKTLTASAVQNELIQSEMNLGKTVQQSFIQVPKLPDGVSISYAHEAATFVSGDTIFSHYDERRARVTAVMCDVTGHGVQAALKASICSAVCDFIWNDSRTRDSDTTSDRMNIFFQRVTGMLSKVSREAEMLAMIGCEISLTTREVTFYRANAVFPIILSQNKLAPENWKIDVLSFPECSHQTIPIHDPFYVLLFSDGMLDSSRSTKLFVDWLTVRVAGKTHLPASDLKNLIMEFQDWPKTHDDRTMVVLEVA